MTLRDRTFFCSSTTSSVSHRQAPRFPLCWDVCPRQLVISLHWQLKWALSRSVSHLHIRALSHRYRQFTFPPMTLQTLLLRPHLLTWTQQRSFPEAFLRWVSTPPLTLWIPHREYFLPISWAVSIMRLQEPFRTFSRDIQSFRISSPSWVWTSFPTRISLSLPERERSSVSCPSRSA